MKFKMAVEMEFDIPDVYAKKSEGRRIDEYCEDIAKAIANSTANAVAGSGVGIKYEGCSWLEEHEKQYTNGVLYFGE